MCCVCSGTFFAQLQSCIDNTKLKATNYHEMCATWRWANPAHYWVYDFMDCDMIPPSSEFKYCDAYPLLCNEPVNTFTLKRVATIGRPLIGNALVITPGQQYISVAVKWMFSGWSVPKGYRGRRRSFAVSRRNRSRTNRVLGAQGRRVWLKADYELL
jgi:hypothetical protein